MKCVRPFGLVLVITAIAVVNSMPPDLTVTPRSTLPIGETIQHLSKQLVENNATNNVVLDTRTPPRIKVHKKKDKITPPVENSHAGVAIPVDEDSVILEESTKKMNFYKIERPTTNSGLSTWILLSGQGASTTNKPQSIEKKNMTIMINENINKINKPLFKKRSTTTRKPPMTQSAATQDFTTTQSVSSSISTTSNPKETTKFTKIKASILTNAINKKNINTPTTPIVEKERSTTTRSTTIGMNVKTSPKKGEKKPMPTTTTSVALTVEAKEGEAELPSTTNDNKKSKKPNNKRKKNKNRRRRPAAEKNDTEVAKIDKNKNKEKPISTQLYNYLSREIMPTVGVGLVGLMVTAGLASYFLYPFGVARRSFEVDRKDKEGTYYYHDEYSGGIAEEDAIGKVIAGMVSNTLFPNSYKQQQSNYPTVRYKKVEQPPKRQQHTIQGSVENIHLTSPGDSNINNKNYEDNYMRHPAYQPSAYQNRHYNNKDVMEQSKETGYTVAEQKYPQKNNYEEVTPVAVPEHGPRNMRRRRKRSILKENDIDNEISYDPFDKYVHKFQQYNVYESTESENQTSTEATTDFPDDNNGTSNPNIDDLSKEPNENSSTTMKIHTTDVSVTERPASVMDLLTDLLRLKISLGLQILQNATLSIANYVTKVQRSFNQHYQNHTYYTLR